MARLEVRLFGPFQVTLDGVTVSGFDSDKVRGLLAYLAVEGSRPHRREKLAGLLWPDFPERSARTNLRRALANLRQVIGDHQAEPPFLHITRQTIQFNHGSDAWVDAVALQSALTSSGTDISRLEEAAKWYQRVFLEGFSIADSPAFEEWTLVTREALGRELLAALGRLADHYERLGDFEQALAHARRAIELEPYREEGQQQVMRLLALGGRRSEALAQYETFQKLLAQELEVAPTAETEALYERIRSGELTPETAEPRQPVVRGYELRERLGAGSFGVVYRAYQPAVGRDVAVKIIRPRFANDPDFIRRFEAEAHLVARLEHPHIVPLYDFWREPDGAFLVMRWLRAGSLLMALARGPWRVEMAVGLLDQIAAALTIAHRQGVVHRDIKPSNILLDDDGNAYLTDFGLATLTGPMSSLSDMPVVERTKTAASSLGYQSPEVAQGAETTAQADIYSLGIVAFELLTGEPPFPTPPPQHLAGAGTRDRLPIVAELRPDLPAAVDEIIQRATDEDLDARYKDVASLADDFRRVLLPGTTAGPRVDTRQEAVRNPYKGLRPFQEADAADFYGRDALVDRLVAMLTPTVTPSSASTPTPALPHKGGSRFLAVVGPSGSGKSSVIQAGLLPALRRGALPGSERWFIVEMVPGTHPLEELETALLRVAVKPPDSLLGQIREDERGLLRAVRRVLPDDASELLLVIDQFEELFTLVPEERERAEFLDRLTAAVTDERTRLRVVMTLRADFYDRPLMYPEFGELVEAQLVTVLPLRAGELERAIADPAKQVGVKLEPGLAAAITADVSEQPGALPLLQYALTELFERRAGRRLTLAAYQESGGVLGALARRAEDLYAGLDEAGQEATRQLFLRLVTLGEGVEDTRRRALRSEVISAGSEPAVMEKVLATFGRYRLLTFDHDPETRAPTVEVAHEALLKAWWRLQGWINDSREDLRLGRRLTEAATEWLKSGRDPSYLLRGGRLAQFEAWGAETELSLTETERTYLEASLAERSEREAAEAARQARELALERRSANRLRVLVVVLVVATVVAGWLAVRAARQSELAQQEARASRGRELAAAAIGSLDVDPELGVWLAMMAVDATRAEDGLVLPEAEDALHRAVQASRALLTLPGPFSSSFSPDGRRLATAGEDNTAKIWDATTGDEWLTLTGHSNDILGVYINFSSDGTRVVTGSSDRTAKVWDAETGELLATLSGHEGGVGKAVFSPDGRLVATSSEDGTARIWDASTGQEVRVFRAASSFFGLAFSPDGLRLAAADVEARVARVWDLDTGQELLALTGHTDDLIDVAYSPDGRWLATASSDLSAKLWDATTGEEVRTLTGHSGFVYTVQFSPDGAWLATGSADSTAKIWETDSGRELLSLVGHDGAIFNVAFGPDGQRLATSSEDRTTKVWDLGPSGKELIALVGHTDLPFSVDYSPDGKRLATSSWDGTAKVWDGATGRELFTLPDHTDQVNRATFDPSGERLATAGKEGVVKVWDAATGDELLAIQVVSDLRGDLEVAFSPDGNRLATGDGHGQAIIWDARTGEKLNVFSGHGDYVFQLDFSADGAYLATAGFNDNTAKLWDLKTGEEIATLSVFGARVTSVAFDPGTTRLAATSFDAKARVWDLEALLAGPAEEPPPLLTLELDAPVWDVVFSPDGGRLATISFDGQARLWDAETGQETLVLREYNNGPNLAFSPDGKHLATTSGDGVVRVFVLPIDDLMALARSRLTRAPTGEECRQYLHLETCPPD